MSSRSFAHMPYGTLHPGYVLLVRNGRPAARSRPFERSSATGAPSRPESSTTPGTQRGTPLRDAAIVAARGDSREPGSPIFPSTPTELPRVAIALNDVRARRINVGVPQPAFDLSARDVVRLWRDELGERNLGKESEC